MSTQSYWFSEMGLWGSVPVDTYEFGPEHHADLDEIFEWVHEHQLGDFMAYLQSRPHERTGLASAPCTTCEDLVDQFGVM